MVVCRHKHALYDDTDILITLFRHVENAKEVKHAAMQGLLEASVIKASMVLDSFVALVAANKAVHSYRTGTMATHTLHAEIIYSLSSGKKITHALNKFGVSESETDILVVITGLRETVDSVFELLCSIVKGKQVSVEELPSLANVAAIHEEYKLSDSELATCSSISGIISRIASKSIATI